MPVFDSLDQLDREASDLYCQENNLAAALVWAKARQVALTLGDLAQAFRMGYWEAASISDADPKKCREMLFLLLSDVPADAPAYERWGANARALFLQIALRPEKALLKRQLAELDRLSQTLPVPAGDLPISYGVFPYLQGHWAEALGYAAKGWQEFDGNGCLRSDTASLAASCCLRLGRPDEARSWLQPSRHEDPQVWVAVRNRIGRFCLCLGLFDGDHALVAESLEADTRDPALQVRGHLFRRAASLDPLDDPADPTHPAHKLAHFERKSDVHDRFDQLLALVDYRLACLRYTVGLPAMDDFFYRRPDVIPAVLEASDPVKLDKQLRSFRFTWHLLRRLALRLDSLLECDWRTKEAESRWDRAEAIAHACGVRLNPHNGLALPHPPH